MTPENITAVILAGGLGTRLRSVVADRPKVIAEVNGRPFLHFLFEQLIAAGFKRAVLCTGYLSETVRTQLGERYKSLSLEYSEEHEPLGTGGAVRLALTRLTSDPTLVMNGDSFCDVDLRQFLQSHMGCTAEASLTLASVNNISRFGAVTTDPTGKVSRFEEKGTLQGAGLINAGVYLLSRNVIAAIPAGVPVSLERDVFPQLIISGLHGFVSSGAFIDIGIPDDYHAAELFFKRTHFAPEVTS